MLEKLLEKKISDSPEYVKKALNNFAWSETLLTISKKHALGLDKITFLKREIMLIVTGLTQTTEFSNHIQQQLGLSFTSTEILVQDINNLVLQPLQKIIFSRPETQDIEEDDDYLLHDIEHSQKYEGHTPEIKESLERNPEVIEDILDLDQTEFDVLYTKNGIVPGMVPSQKEHIQAESEQEKYTKLNKNELTELIKENYQEFIEERDLQGKTKHRTNTKILKQQYQEKPENVFDVDINEALAPFSKKVPVKKQSLEEEIMKMGMLSKGDNLDFSPKKEEGSDVSFLESLS